MNQLKILCFLFLGFYFLLINSATTSADLADETKIKNNQMAATTLSFSDQNTANNQPLSQLFKTNGLVFGGFDLSSIRVKKDGKMGFKYQLQTEIKGSDDLLCKALDLELWQNQKVKYQGKLSGFNFQSDLNGSLNEDWIFILKLDNESQTLMNKTCEFNFLLTTFRKDLEEKGGFRDEKIITNLVLSGRW